MDQALEKYLQKVADERRAELAEEAKQTCSKEEAERQYKFLTRWSRKGVLSRVSDASTFWSKGSLMTKISPAEVNGLVAHGYATVSPSGGTLTLIKGK